MDGVGELGLTKFSLGGKEAGSAFYAGTEEGELVFADWLSTKDDEGGDTSNERVAWIARDHFRPCLALERSPFFPEVILSLGDWSFNLWYDGVKSPIFTSPTGSAYFTCAKWSPTRPGVLIIGKVDGTLDVWDLTDQSHKPSVSVPVASCSVTSMSFRVSSNQQVLGVGDSGGNLHILGIPRNLMRKLGSEESSMKTFFEREGTPFV